MGLMSPEGENLLAFLELRTVPSTYDGDHRDPLLWPQERPVPMRVARWPLGIPLSSMLGLRPCEESVPLPENSSPVEMGMSGNFSSCSKGVKDPWEVPEVRCD